VPEVFATPRPRSSVCRCWTLVRGAAYAIPDLFDFSGYRTWRSSRIDVRDQPATELRSPYKRAASRILVTLAHDAHAVSHAYIYNRGSAPDACAIGSRARAPPPAHDPAHSDAGAAQHLQCSFPGCGTARLAVIVFGLLMVLSHVNQGWRPQDHFGWRERAHPFGTAASVLLTSFVGCYYGFLPIVDVPTAVRSCPAWRQPWESCCTRACLNCRELVAVGTLRIRDGYRLSHVKTTAADRRMLIIIVDTETHTMLRPIEPLPTCRADGAAIDPPDDLAPSGCRGW